MFLKNSIFANYALDYTQAHSKVDKITDDVDDGKETSFDSYMCNCQLMSHVHICKLL